MKSILIDTNLLLDDSNIIYKLSKEYDQIIISNVVLKELDKHKYNPDLSYSARNAIKAIRTFKETNPDKLIFHVSKESIDNNDSFIIETAKKRNAVLATKDVSMSIIAESEDVESKLYDVVLNNVFNPYFNVDIIDIYKVEPAFPLQNYYKNEDYSAIINFLNVCMKQQLPSSSWFFLFLKDEVGNTHVYANNPIKKVFERIDNNHRYNKIKCGNREVKSLDIYQNCAIYALEEAPNVLITGRWGSGKTLLSTAHAIKDNNKKTFITRPPIGINKKYDVGFMPGDKQEKMMDWLSGFTSALYYIFGNTNGQIGKNTSYNYVKDTLFPQLFEILPLNSIQGLSLLDKDVLLIDEVQLISVDYMSMILSRPTKTGKLVLMGDLQQTYNIVKPSESGLLKLIRCLPHPSMALINLPNSYRSDLLELADKLQDKTIG